MAGSTHDFKITSTIDLPKVLREGLQESLAIAKSDGQKIADALREVLNIDLSKLLSGTGVKLPPLEAPVVQPPPVPPPPPPASPGIPPSGAPPGSDPAAAAEAAAARIAAVEERQAALRAELEHKTTAEILADRDKVAERVKVLATAQAEETDRAAKAEIASERRAAQERQQILSQAAKGPVSEGNTGQLSAGFAQAKRELQQLLTEQTQAAAALDAGGSRGSAAYNHLAKEIAETSEKLKVMEKAEQTAAANGETAVEKLKEKFKEVATVAGGVVLGGGVQGLAQGFEHGVEAVFEGGKKLFEQQEELKIGLQTAGVSAKNAEPGLEVLAEATKHTSNEFAISRDILNDATATYLKFGGTADNIGQKQELIAGLAKRAGVSLDQAAKFLAKGTDPAIEAQLTRIGIKFEKNATESERFDIISKKLSGTLEGMKDAAEGPIGAVEKAKNSFQFLIENVGLALLNVAAPALQLFSKVAGFLEDNIIPAVKEFTDSGIGKLIIGLLAGGVAVGVVILAFELLVPLFPTLSAGFASVWAAATGPVALVVAAVAAVIIAIKLLYDNVRPVRLAIDSFWEGLKNVASTVATAVAPILEKLWTLLKTIGAVIVDVVVANFRVFYTIISSVVQVVFSIISAVVTFIGHLTGLDKLFKSSGSGASFFEKALKLIGEAIDNVIQFFDELDTAVSSVSAIFDSVSEDVSKIANIISNIDFSNVFASIGKIQDIVEHTADKAGDAFQDRINEKLKDKAVANAFGEGFKKIAADVKRQIDALPQDLEESVKRGKIDKIVEDAIQGHGDLGFGALATDLQKRFGDAAQGVGELITDSAKELRELVPKEIKTEVTPEVKKDAVEKAALDLQSTLSGIQQKTQAATAAIEEKGLQDSVARQRLALQAKADAEIASVNETQRKSLAAITKAEHDKQKITVQNDKGETVDITPAEARKKLEDEVATFKVKRQEQATQDIRAFDAEELKKGFDDARAAAERRAQVEININTRKLGLIKGATEQAEQDRAALQLKNFDLTAGIDVDKAIRGTEEFQTKLAEVQAKIRSGDLTVAEGKQQLDAVIASIRTGNEEITSLIATQGDQRIKLETDIANRAALARAGQGAGTLAELQRATELEKLRQDIDARLAIIEKGSLQEEAILRESAARRAAIEKKYLQDSQNAYNVSLDAKEALEGAFTLKLSEEDKKRLADERAALVKSDNDLLDALHKREISYNDFTAKVGENAKKRRELEEKEGRSSADADARIKAAGIKAAQEFEKRRIDAFTAAQGEFLASLDRRNALELSKAGKSAAQQMEIDNAIGDNDKEVKEKQGRFIGNLVAAGSAGFLTMIAQGQQASKAFGKLMFDIVEKSIPALVSLIFGQSIATLGPILGPIVSGALVGTLIGLAEIGKAALHLKEGRVGVRGPGGTKGDRIPVMMSDWESVMNAEATLAGGTGPLGNQAAFTWANMTGQPVLNYFLQRPEVQLRPEVTRIAMAGPASVVTHQDLKKVFEARDQKQEKHNEKMLQQQKNIVQAILNTSTDLTVSGKVKGSDLHLIHEKEQTRQRSK